MSDTTPLLRTLAPALRGLERRLRGWLDGPHRPPLSTITRAALEGMADDLRRQADALDMDRPLLVIMLMGGTGVGKSTLLNALAGGAASPRRRSPGRPRAIRSSTITIRFAPIGSTRHCATAGWRRTIGRSWNTRVIVDTPDLDSNDLANRDKLIRLLPVADIVLYVGSQEKYHDQIGWELFLEHRKRRAFAFVLNKWDRCVHAGAAGLRPDEDLLRDLQGRVSRTRCCSARAPSSGSIERRPRRRGAEDDAAWRCPSRPRASSFATSSTGWKRA